METRILIVDDDSSIRRAVKGLLEDEGYSVVTASNGEEAVSMVDAEHFDVLLLDIVLPGMDGLEVLDKVKQSRPKLPVIMISGQATVDNAIRATKLGAYDFLEKPIVSEKLLLVLAHVLESEELKRQSAKRYTMIGKSTVMQSLYREIEKAAPSSARVLIRGESGTGKELIARAIHEQSSISSHPFVTVNCAAIPGELIESELFGHERGAFTGAAMKRDGKFLLADKGTLFLDEIGDMNIEAQSKLLRVLEEGEVEPVGGKSPIKVNVRVLSATNKNLEDDAEKGDFRQDLLFRINVIPISAPPLRQRTGDIEILTKYFIGSFCEENGKKVKDVKQDAVRKLEEYSWPGNVRELKNCMERLAIMVASDTITAKNVESLLPMTTRPSTEGLSFQEQVDDFEKRVIQETLARTGGNVKKTAELLKTDRANLYRKIRKYDLLVGR
jgi:two-component system nitrogen regulation response regulator NtrX